MRYRTRLGAAMVAVTVAAVATWAAIGQAGPAAADVTTAPTLAGGNWQQAQALAGPAAITSSAYFPSQDNGDLSCAAPGNCSAIGGYRTTDPATNATDYHTFVVSEVNGAWGQATTLSVGGTLGGSSTPGPQISCSAPGDCAAYVSAGNDAYLVSQTDGSWGSVQPVSMGAYLNQIDTISCPSTGDCTAAGTYRDSAADPALPFVIDQSGGKWQTPRAVTGIASLTSASVSAQINSVSCWSPGNCTAGGFVRFGTAGRDAFLVTESSSDGWGSAQLVPGLASLQTTGSQLHSVSCTGPGDCGAVGTYYNGSTRLFAIDSTNGIWGMVHTFLFPGDSLFSEATNPNPSDASCSSPGNCAVTGTYVAGNAGSSLRVDQAFVANESDGSWTIGETLPDIETGNPSFGTSVSCFTAGDCTIMGQYRPEGSGSYHVYVADDDVNSLPPIAHDVQGLFNGIPSIAGLSCDAPGYCSAVGQDAASAFTLGEATSSAAVMVGTTHQLIYGDEQAAPLAFAATSTFGTPTGSVSLTTDPSGSYPVQWKTSLCSGTLAGGGHGSCTLKPTALPGGGGPVAAVYGGDINFAPAVSAAVGVSVALASTTSSLSISPTAVAYGTHYKAVGTVHVRPQFAGTPTGQFLTYLNGKPAGLFNLGNGEGTFTLPTGLKVGRYKVTVTYQGDHNFKSSTSNAVYLTVARATSTSLTLSKTTITDGHETAEKLTVSVSHVGSTYATGKVTIKAFASATSASGTTLCTITLKRGTGSCILRATQLKAGTYYLAASYSGDGNYLPSSTPRKSLKVNR